MKRANTKAAMDPARPLKPARWEAFAQDVFGGMTQAAAYRKHYDAARYKPEKLHIKASELAGKVRGRIEWLQSRSASKAILTKEQLAEGYSRMFQTTIADFIEVDADGAQFVKVTKASMAALALKKVKVKEITSAAGVPTPGIYLTEIELESKVAAGKALSALMGYDPRQSIDIHADQETRDFLSSVLGTGVEHDREAGA